MRQIYPSYQRIPRRQRGFLMESKTPEKPTQENQSRAYAQQAGLHPDKKNRKKLEVYA
jgi:hypothetical protein